MRFRFWTVFIVILRYTAKSDIFISLYHSCKDLVNRDRVTVSTTTGTPAAIPFDKVKFLTNYEDQSGKGKDNQMRTIRISFEKQRIHLIKIVLGSFPSDFEIELLH